MTGDVRLVGGVANSSSGLLEVCAKGVWGTVCDYKNEWNHENVAVVCHQLNFTTTSQCATCVDQIRSINISATIIIISTH